MNYCRTCKYWAASANMVGAGVCVNVDVHLRIYSEQRLITAHNYGCVLHEDGDYVACMWTKDQLSEARERFIRSYAK